MSVDSTVDRAASPAGLSGTLIAMTLNSRPGSARVERKCCVLIGELAIRNGLICEVTSLPPPEDCSPGAA